jgi:hypothetical protein
MLSRPPRQKKENPMPRPTDEYLATLTPSTREYILELERRTASLLGFVRDVAGVRDWDVEQRPQKTLRGLREKASAVLKGESHAD